MSDPRPTARAFARQFFRDGRPMGDFRSQDDQNRLTAAITADRAASDAREDRLREALERIRDCTSRADAGGCETCQDEARAALAAIPPRSDR